jgi:hypothetical protein
MPLPSFVVGGAPKAGTTAMWALLSQHPQVEMSHVKEPVFLTRMANQPAPGIRHIGPPRANNFSKGLAWYEKLWERDDVDVARGEASAHYIGTPDTPQIIQDFLPKAKVILLLRDPVGRAYSHYWEYRKRGYAMPPFETVLDDDPTLRYLLWFSRYHQHVTRFIDTLGGQRLLVLLYEDLRADPAGTYRRVCSFIGVDPEFQPDFGHEFNPHAEPVSRRLQTLTLTTKRLQLHHLPKVIRRPAGRLRSLIEGLNLRPTSYPELAPEVRRVLIGEFEEDIAFAEDFLRPLPEWRS